ncbi:hypothetical protein GWI33_006577 [Rhynchophorus ferrugineus]|uniref:Uncharacterized protein n=1 Tax=Rhynchophorus ferrugineus TaxID=354439 RepID=A0A834III3_RHYFE|nr:hypothetical protein GWI33_006577 [Rhynchophorus ferrugineus]
MDCSLSQCNNVILEAKRILLNEQIDKIGSQGSENEDMESSVCSEQYILTIQRRPTTQQPTCYTNNNNFLIRKYFTKWKEQTQFEKCPQPNLESFLSNLQHHKEVCSTKKEKMRDEIVISGNNFKNRYKAQKNIIDNQRAKLEEQEKIISELKLGIIREDLLKSIEKTKFNIRDIFSHCSGKLLLKAPLIQPPDEREKIMVSSQKAPKLVQQMEKRALERAKCRELILERKKLMEAARQKLLEEAIEKKRFLEEEERKRSIELINEQRKKQMELRRIRQYKRHIFEEKMAKAQHFYHNLLIMQTFRKLYTNYNNSRYNWSLAVSHHLYKTKATIFKHWMGYVESKYEVKYELADAHFNYKLLKEGILKWKEFKLNCIRSRQVAEDFYDFKLIHIFFVHWHRYVCKQAMIEHKKLQIAKQHHNRLMLFHYFYLWKSLPAVLQLEKAQEERKRKWREKVWEIVPDYQPPKDL